MSRTDDSEVVVLFAIFHACLHLSPIAHHTQHLVEDGRLGGGLVCGGVARANDIRVGGRDELRFDFTS